MKTPAYRVVLLFAYGCIIAWLSLTPSPPSPPGFLAWDKMQHAAAYAPFTMLAGWTFSTVKKFSVNPWFWAMVVTVAFGALMEIMQGTCTTSRVAEMGDLAADAVGAGIISLAMGWRRRRIAVSKMGDDVHEP